MGARHHEQQQENRSNNFPFLCATLSAPFFSFIFKFQNASSQSWITEINRFQSVRPQAIETPVIPPNWTAGSSCSLDGREEKTFLPCHKRHRNCILISQSVIRRLRQSQPNRLIDKFNVIYQHISDHLQLKSKFVLILIQILIWSLNAIYWEFLSSNVNFLIN